MRKVFDTFSWLILIVLAAPTLLIMFSWGSLPGDPLYFVKRSMESSMAFVAPTSSVKSGLYIKYTERRFAEATQLLNEKESAEGLPYFSSQVEDTTKSIINAPSSEIQRQLAYTYIDKLSEMQAKLATQKLTFAHIEEARSAAPLVVSPTATPTSLPSNGRTEIHNSPTPVSISGIAVTPVPTPGPGDQETTIVNQLDQTQATVEKALKDLEVVVKPAKKESKSNKNEKKAKKEEKKDKKKVNSTPTPTVKKYVPTPTPTEAEIVLTPTPTEEPLLITVTPVIKDEP